MKRASILLSLALIVVIAFNFSACSNGSKDDASNTQTTQQVAGMEEEDETTEKQVRTEEPLTEESLFMIPCKHMAMCEFFREFDKVTDENQLFWQAVVGAMTENNPNDDSYEKLIVTRETITAYLDAMYPDYTAYPPYPSGDLINEVKNENGDISFEIEPCYYGDEYGSEVTEVVRVQDYYEVHVTVYDYDGDAEIYYIVNCQFNNEGSDDDLFDYNIISVERNN